MHGIESNPGPPEQKPLKIAHVNINGITAENKLDELEQFIETNDIQILAVTETKLDKTVGEAQYSINDFHPPLTKHRTRHGGGVALYVHKSLPVQRLCNIEIGEEEWVWAKIKTHDFTLLVNCIYLPPTLLADRLQNFLNTFTESYCRAQTHLPTAIISLGDFNAGNIYLADQSGIQHSGITSFDQKLRETMQMLDLNQIIDQPTRIAHNTNNLRDLIFTSNSSIVQHSGVLSSFANLDHFPIYAELNFVSPSLTRDTELITTIWDYQKMDAMLLTNMLLTIDWTGIVEKDVDTATSEFIAALNYAASTAIPRRHLKRKRNSKSWISTDLKRNIRKRDRLFKRAKETQSSYDWARWRHQRNAVSNMNRQLKSEYIKAQVEKLLTQKNDPYKYHKTLRSITYRTRDDTIPPLLGPDGDVVTNDQDKATIFVNHFAAQSTIDVPDNHAPPTSITNEQVPTLEHITTSEQEVLRILNTLDTNKSTGPDGLPAKFLKLTALLIAKPLSQLFNKSLSLGVYPKDFKKANVKPIFKNKGSPSDPTCYRPISILPVISKVFEKIVHRHIYDHIIGHALLSDKQSGFRRNHSTELQLHYLNQKLHESLDSGNDFTAIYLDISKYFDKIWHEGLLHKCKNEFGITGSLLNWLKSYLSDRSQRVQVRNSSSGPREINAGCPQGSVLGPLLALIYLNNLSQRINNEILLFADDTSLYASHTATNLPTIQASLQKDLNEIHRYGQKWAITFNASKTTQQTFSRKKENHPPTLTFEGVPIRMTDSHKHLGLIFSKDLRFHEHINEILNKANKAARPLYAIAPYLPRPTLDQLYKVYIRPYFDYCDTIYDGHLTIRDTTRLETFQNRFARLTTGTLFRTSSDKLRTELGWDKLTTRRRIHRLTLYHKVTLSLSERHTMPNHITSLIPHTRVQDTGRTLRNADHRTQAQTRTTTYQRSFFNLTGHHWNQLPSDIKRLSFKDFKKYVTQQLSAQKPPIYYSYGNKTSNCLHTRLRTGMSHLNAHMYKIQKSDTPACSCGYPQENTAHYALTCPKYTSNRKVLFENLSNALQYDFSQKSRPIQLQILLHGTNLSGGDGRAVARHFQNYLQNTLRFSNT